jgi:hypothetical protein
MTLAKTGIGKLALRLAPLYRTSKFTMAPEFTRCPGAGVCETMMLAGEG